MKKFMKRAGMFALAGAAVPAFAQSGGIDISDVLTGMAAAGVAVGAIGAAVTSGPRLMKATWGWIKAAVS